MGKYKMPTHIAFLKKKSIYSGPKKDPVWVYLEREMRSNIVNKPYNESVGEWLKFLKDLKYFYHLRKQMQLKRLERETGPPWFNEFSRSQRNLLEGLKMNIQQDLLEDVVYRTRRSLYALGITMKISKRTYMQAMTKSMGDAGIFFWHLYTAVFKVSPSVLQPRYGMNARIMMSSLVFIDLDRCIEQLNALTRKPKIAAPPAVLKDNEDKKNKKYKVRYGAYLQSLHCPLYCPHPSPNEKKPPVPPLEYKFKIRTVESYEKLREDESFLERRKFIMDQEKISDRPCEYIFWEPPPGLRNVQPDMQDLAKKMKMVKMKAKHKHVKHLYHCDRFFLGGIAYTGGEPHFLLSNVVTLATGYIPIHGGMVLLGKEYINVVQGYWKHPKSTRDACDETCECMKWEDVVFRHLKESKCKCGHRYDLNNEGKQNEKYFHRPSKNTSFFLDHAKIFQMDPKEDHIKDTVVDAVISEDNMRQRPSSTQSMSNLDHKALLGSLLADLSHTSLLIPHLPEAHYLNNLLEWVRHRVEGKLTPKQHRNLHLKTLRRWLDLKHFDFQAKANRIPFTQKQLANLNWTHRPLMGKLFEILIADFISRNRFKQMEQARLWWATMQYDQYPNKAFLEVFFTYMPGRWKDVFLLN